MERLQPIERIYHVLDPKTGQDTFVGFSKLSTIVDLAARQFKPDRGPGTADDKALRKGPGALDLGKAIHAAAEAGASREEIHEAFELERN